MRIGLLGPSSTRELADLLDAADGLPPGMGGFPVTLLARNLVERGHDVHLWTLDRTVRDVVRAAGPGLHVTWVPCRPGGRGRDAYRDERRRLRHAVDTAVAAGAALDVINAHWSYEYALAVRGRPEPTVVSVHDWAPTVLRYQPDPYRLVRLGMFLRTHLDRPAMTTPSPYLQAHLRRFGLGHAEVVPNGVPVERFAAAPRRRGPDMHLVGIAMGFGRRKNTQALLHAHARLRAAGVPTTLTLVGSEHGPGEAAAAWADAEGLTDGVTFLGPLPYDGVLDLLGRCDLFVHPAREESFGMVLIEALAQGTPVVGGARSGAVPWVLEGGGGVLVDVEDPGAIAAAVHQLLRDPAAWERRSADGLASTRRRFGMDVVTDAYLAVYEAARR
jgi:glycosyltransferase involved in cell wall biosynthesis